MSTRHLSDTHILLLSKGLSFVPTPKDSGHFELLKDFNRFCEKIRSLSKPTQANSHDNDKTISEKPLKKKLQTIKPRQHYASYTDLEGVLEEIKLEISHIPTADKIPYNLSREERKALRELKGFTDLVINKADKGSTIVVQNRTDYIKDAYEHLNGPNTYIKLDGDPTISICRGIIQLLNKFYSEGLLNKKMVDFCSPPLKARLARLYFLKKIHKSPMGIRPIVSSCGSPTENISQFVDYWLQPIMKKLPSFIKDTTAFINQLNETVIEPDTLLVTIDVKSLYTCIPQKEGMLACSKALNDAKANNPSQPNTDVLISLLEIVLKNNIFEFNGECFLQLQGTAMGTKLAPAYANIFMDQLEQTILSSAPLKPSYYKRYIDDILMLWPHSINDLMNFITALNNYHPLIKFTFEHSHEQITFLDVNVFKGPNFHITNKLDVATHIKPTNKQAYLHAKSYHPPGTSKGIIIGEMKRYLRTNSRAESFIAFKSKHKQNLLKRGYHKDFINQYTKCIRFRDRSLALKPKPKGTDQKRIAFVTRYTPSATKAGSVYFTDWTMTYGLDRTGFYRLN